MSYTDGRFDARYVVKVKDAFSFGTTTANSATGANLTAAVIKCYLPKFWRRTKLVSVRMIPTVIPDAGSTALVAHFMNGTDTAATVTLTTATVGAVLSGSVTTAYATYTADSQAEVKTTGTSTASADAMGSYDIYFELQELFS